MINSKMRIFLNDIHKWLLSWYNQVQKEENAMPLIRSPFDKNGNIRYFEALKIIVIMSLLIAFVSSFVDSVLLPLNQALPWLTWVFAVMMTIQAFLMVFSESRELQKLILDFVLRPVSLRREPVLLAETKMSYVAFVQVKTSIFGPSQAQKIRC